MKPTYHAAIAARYTRHAALRMQQRSIPAAAVDLLLDYAEPAQAGDGALSYRFTRRTWAGARTALGPTARAFEKFRNAYVIESGDGTIITAAWLH